MTDSFQQRILWNRRPIDASDDGDIDEIVVQGIVHIEQMDIRCWWIGIEVEGGGYWAGNFYADSKGRMTFAQQEQDGFEWDHDDSHERDQA